MMRVCCVGCKRVCPDPESAHGASSVDLARDATAMLAIDPPIASSPDLAKPVRRTHRRPISRAPVAFEWIQKRERDHRRKWLLRTTLPRDRNCVKLARRIEAQPSKRALGGNRWDSSAPGTAVKTTRPKQRANRRRPKLLGTTRTRNRAPGRPVPWPGASRRAAARTTRTRRTQRRSADPGQTRGKRTPIWRAPSPRPTRDRRAAAKPRTRANAHRGTRAWRPWDNRSYSRAS